MKHIEALARHLGARTVATWIVVVAAVAAVGACNSDSAVGVSVLDRVALIAVSLSSTRLTIGQTEQASVTLKNSSGVTLNGSKRVAWSSANSAIASVDASSGMVTGVSVGSTIITASAQGASGSATVDVALAPVATIVVDLAVSSIGIGESVQPVDTVRDAQGNTLSGRVVRWSTSDPTVATVDSVSGLAKGIAVGQTTLTATSEGHSASATLTVAGSGGATNPPATAPVASVTVSLAQASVNVGATTQATAIALDASGNVLTGRTVAWQSSNALVASVDPSSGVVTGISAGSATITGVSEGRSGSATVAIVAPPASQPPPSSPPPVASVAVSLAASTITVGTTTQATAVTRDASGNTLTGRTIIWSSSAPSVASVDAATGVVGGVAAGTATITATSEGKTGSATITVSVVPVASVSVALGASSLTVGGTTTATATARDANGNILTGRTVAWSSSASAVAIVVPATGIVTAVAPGTATITATSEGKTGSATITVSVVPVASVSVALGATSLSVGGTTTATATARDANGNILTGRTVAWSSSASAVAIVVPATGIVTAVAPGTATITATSEGKTGGAVVTVQAAVVATQLAVATQPSASAQAGVPFAQQPAVQLRDGGNNPVSQPGVIVTVAIATGGGTLAGTTTATTNAAGVALFSNLSITGVDGARTLSFAAPPLSSTTSTSITVSNPVVSPSGGCDNEPTGYTRIQDEPWNSSPAYGVTIVDGWRDDLGNGATRLSIINDPTSPFPDGNHNVIQGLFPAGSPGGSGPFSAYRPFGATEQFKNLYICVYLKHDANFNNTNGNTGTKFMWPAGDKQQGSSTYTGFNGSSMDFEVFQQNAVDRELKANMNGTANRMVGRNGQWVKYELLLKANTNNSTANGELDVWIDGVQTHHYTDVNWQMNTARTWLSLTWNPTYGGGLNPVPHDQWQYIDHIRISGSNQ